MIQTMRFFKALSVRIPLALIGGILYGLLTYHLTGLFTLSFDVLLSASILVFLFYLGSRLLILLSGADSLYYSGKRRSLPPFLAENESFVRTCQWVGALYHYHDIALFLFLVLISILFVATLIADQSGGKRFGDTFQNLLNTFERMAILLLS